MPGKGYDHLKSIALVLMVSLITTQSHLEEKSRRGEIPEDLPDGRAEASTKQPLVDPKLSRLPPSPAATICWLNYPYQGHIGGLQPSAL